MRTAVLVAFTLLVGLLPANAQAQAAAATWTRTDFVLDGAGGVHLAASLWMPNGAGPFPAVVETNGWNNRHDQATELEFAEHFAGHGYAVLGYTSRGWGNSEGEIELDGPNEVADARTAIDYLAAQPKVLLDKMGDPRVGFVGESYAGGLSLLVAQADARVDAIIPRITWNNLLRALAPNDVAKVGWISELYGTGQTVGRGLPVPGQHPGDQPEANGPSAKLTEWYAELMGTNAPTDEMRTEIGQVRSVTPGKLTVPTLLVQGWGDTLFPPSEALATYDDLSARGVPVQLVLYPGGHGQSLPHDSDAWLATVAAMDDWFAVHLRHDLPKQAPYPILRLGEANNPLSALGDLQWPPTGTNRTKLYLAGTALDADPTKAAGSTQMANPVTPTNCVDVPSFQSSVPQCPHLTDGTYAIWSAPAASANTILAGQPIAHLIVSSTQPQDVRIFATLVDRNPDGTQLFIARQTVPAHLASAASATALDLPMQDIGYTLQAGHQLGLLVTTNDVAFASSRVPGAITITSSPAAPSWLEYPVAPLVPQPRLNLTATLVVASLAAANTTVPVRISAASRLDVPVLGYSIDGGPVTQLNTTGQTAAATWNVTLSPGTHVVHAWVGTWTPPEHSQHTLPRLVEVANATVTARVLGACGLEDCPVEPESSPGAGTAVVVALLALAVVQRRRRAA